MKPNTPSRAEFNRLKAHNIEVTEPQCGEKRCLSRRRLARRTENRWLMRPPSVPCVAVERSGLGEGEAMVCGVGREEDARHIDHLPDACPRAGRRRRD
jgi:hypothetical protein